MPDTKMTGWQRFLAWFLGISCVLLVTSYLTADQWLGFVTVIVNGGAH